MRDLFRGYNKLIRPVENMTNNVDVAFGLAFIQLINVVSVSTSSLLHRQHTPHPQVMLPVSPHSRCPHNDITFTLASHNTLPTTPHTTTTHTRPLLPINHIPRHHLYPHNTPANTHMVVSALGSKPRRAGFKSRVLRGKWVSLLTYNPCSPSSK